MWDPPRPGVEPTSPALAGGFLTTGPPAKSLTVFLTLLFDWTRVKTTGFSKPWLSGTETSVASRVTWSVLRETELRVMKLAIPYFISKSKRVEIIFFTFIQAFPAKRVNIF